MTAAAYFEPGGRQPTPAYGLDSLSPGQRVAGPAILIDKISTVIVEPGWSAFITAEANVRIDRAAGGAAGGAAASAAAVDESPAAAGDVECDPIQLAIFSHR